MDESLVVLVLRAEGGGPAELFEREGAEVRRAGTVEEAAHALDPSPADLALVDLDDAEAADAACTVLREKMGPSVPIAAVALDSDDATAEELRRAGADFTLRDAREMSAFLKSWKILARLSMKVRRLEREIPARIKELSDIRTFTDELVASLPLRLFVVDEEMRVLFANRAAVEPAGLDSVTAAGRGLSEIIPAAAAEDGPLAAMVRRALIEDQPGRIGGMHVALERGAGEAGLPEERVVNADVRPCPVAGMRAALLTISDITDAWKAESGRLHESRKLTEVVDAIGAGLATLDEDLRFTWTNRAFIEWFGHSTERGCKEVFSGLHEDCADCAAARALSGGGRETALRHRYTHAGRRQSFRESFSALREPDGTASLIVLVQDVTSSVDRVEQMQLVERMSRAVQGVRDLDELLQLMLTCVTTGHALGFNRAFLLLRNRRTNTLDGRMAVGPASAEEAFRVWAELAGSQQTLDDALRDAKQLAPTERPLFNLIRDLRYSLDDVRELPVRVFRERKAILVRNTSEDDRVAPEFLQRFEASELLAVPLLSKGRSVGVLMADNLYNGRPIEQRDLEILSMFASPAGLAIENAESFADLRESLGTLRRTRRQLVDQTKLAAVGRVAAHIAHEIRNPLATIGGFAHSICSRPEKADRVKDNARIIYEEVRRLEKMLSGIMDFSRPTRPVPVRQSLNAVVERASGILAEQLAPRVEIDVSLDPAQPETAFDAGQIEQVLTNLVRNAAEAMGENGGHVSVSTIPNEGGAALAVKDDGPGIAKELHYRIFEPFFTTKKGGTGLGLAVCRQIVSEHGGDMRLDSAPGMGTTFTVLLPFEPPSAGERGEEFP